MTFISVSNFKNSYYTYLRYRQLINLLEGGFSDFIQKRQNIDLLSSTHFGNIPVLEK